MPDIAAFMIHLIALLILYWSAVHVARESFLRTYYKTTINSNPVSIDSIVKIKRSPWKWRIIHIPSLDPDHDPIHDIIVENESDMNPNSLQKKFIKASDIRYEITGRQPYDTRH